MTQLITLSISWVTGSTKVQVEPKDAINSLDHCLKQFPRVTYTHNSIILIPQLTFEFYQIQDGDSIFILPDTGIKTICGKLTSGDESMQRFKQLLGYDLRASDLTVMESARFRDRLYNKIEGSTVLTRKLYSTYFRSKVKVPEECDFPTVFHTQEYNQPSNSSLPATW